MKQITLFCLLLALTFANVQASELGVRIERNVPVPMRDGTILWADVHRPDRGGPYPVLVRRSPYGKGRNFDRFVKAGYIVVSQDIRGRYASEGEWESPWRFKTHDAEDGYDTIEWAAKLPGSNGKVGTFGGSASAFVQWRLAPLRPSSLAAMSACSSPARLTHLEMAQGTLLPVGLWRSTNVLSPEIRRRANRPGVHIRWEAQKLWEEGESEKWINWLPWLELPREVFEDETENIKHLLVNPHQDPLKLDEGCKDILVPNLDITGWYDAANSDMVLFRTMVKEAKTGMARKGSRIIIGPWTHTGLGSRRQGDIDFGPAAQLDRISLQIHWFDCWLKGGSKKVGNDPPVKIFVMGDNQWRDEQHWPLQRAKEKILFISSQGHANTPGGGGKLVTKEPQFPYSDNYIYDPRDPVPSPHGLPWIIFPSDQRRLAKRQDILVYQTEPLTERIEVTGNPLVELYASSSAPDTDWLVRLIDVYPDGLALDVSHRIVRARYRNGLDKPKLIKPGEIIKYTVRMRPTSNAFLPGHRIRLDITSSDFPNYDRNHNTAGNQNADATLATAKQTIYHGGKYATRIILLWVPNPIEEKKLTEEKGEPEPEKQIYHLHRAAAEGNLERVKSLISNGIDVNTKGERGNTPLFYAAQAGKMEVVQLLVKAGADVNAGRLTALHGAVDERHRDIAELLIQNGADVNAKDRRGNTPLYYSLQKQDFDMTRLLVAKGADITIRPPGGLTLLHYMSTYDSRDIVEQLLAKGAKVDERDDNYEFTALHYAARFGCKNVAEVLIANGADIKAKDKWDYQPIHWAAHHDGAEVVELLISKGADVSAKTSLGQTPLQLAKVRRNKETVELLLKHGAK